MRSDMRWLLLLTAIIGIVGCANALKATALILGRVPNVNKTTTAATTTTTTSTTVATSDADLLNDEDKKDDGEAQDEDSTKPPLTGIPQIDYIWDPNLPRELNGFNLSTYPFLNSVPDNEDIDFKCDGLHDGFYASIKYSCQLYHHCVYGIRHDFLCANFTAFDQKSFICHFVSEVNCKASPKYWFRNDALYKATTTTSTTTTTVAPPPTTSQSPDRPLRRPDSRRPLRRRRPQHEYYYDGDEYDDDYVEERLNRRRKTNRNRNRRPEYDDDYDNPPRANYKDEDDDYSYEQRSYRHRNRNRDADDDFEYDRRSYRNRKRPVDSKRPYEDDRRPIDDADERRSHSDGRKYQHETPVEVGVKRKNNDRRVMSEDRKTYIDEKSTLDDRRSLGEDDRVHSEDRRSTGHEDRRKLNDDRRPVDEERRSSFDEGRRAAHEKRRPNSERRPQYDDEYDEYPKKQTTREDDYDDRIYGKRPSKPAIIPKVRSSSATASIFNRPRAPPKINRPVPTNEKKKYEYTPTKAEKATTAPPPTDEEIYDEYDYELEKAQPATKHEPVDSKKSYPAPPSQRDQRPLSPLPPKIEFKYEKSPPSFSTDDLLEDEDFDSKERVTSSKPHRSTSPKVVEPVHQQKITKTEYYEKPKDTPIKSNPLPALDFNKDEYIPESDLDDYSDEETDEQLPAKPDEAVGTLSRQPEKVPSRTEYRPSLSAQEHQSKVPETSSIPKPIKEHTDIGSTKIQIPYAPPQPQSDRMNAELLQYKTKFHRLSPAPNVRTAAAAAVEESFHKPNTEPEERDVYTILNKDTISTIREPSGFKPVSYNDQPHDLDLDLPKNRPYVRIMKRPFLPSRGGSPYLPRGLKPVGSGTTSAEYTTEGIGGTHSGSKLPNIGNMQSFAHNLPISRTNANNAYAQMLPLQSIPSSIPSDLRTTTQQPQIESPRSPLDEIFNSDYDVTLNDALNPTLKPLSQSHESPIGFSLNKYGANPYARSDVSHSSSITRTTAIPIPIHSRHAPQISTQQLQQRQQQPLPSPLQPAHHQQQPTTQQQQQQQPQQQQSQQQQQQQQQQSQQQQQQQQQQQRQPQQSQQSQYYDDEYDY